MQCEKALFALPCNSPSSSVTQDNSGLRGELFEVANVHQAKVPRGESREAELGATMSISKFATKDLHFNQYRFYIIIMHSYVALNTMDVYQLVCMHVRLVTHNMYAKQR